MNHWANLCAIRAGLGGEVNLFVATLFLLKAMAAPTTLQLCVCVSGRGGLESGDLFALILHPNNALY